MNVICDIDDTVCDLVGEWIINKYNNDWNDNIKKSNLLDWNIGLYLKDPKNIKYIFQYIEDPTLYDNIKPIKDALWGVNKLRSMGNRVIFVTSSTIGQSGRKIQWLKDHKFFDERKNYIECVDKSLVRGHWMIDDHIDNIKSFQGRAILFGSLWNNDNKQWNLKAKNWKQVINIISSIGEFNYL